MQIPVVPVPYVGRAEGFAQFEVSAYDPDADSITFRLGTKTEFGYNNRHLVTRVSTGAGIKYAWTKEEYDAAVQQELDAECQGSCTFSSDCENFCANHPPWTTVTHEAVPPMLLNIDSLSGRVFWEVGKGPRSLGALTEDNDTYPAVDLIDASVNFISDTLLPTNTFQSGRWWTPGQTSDFQSAIDGFYNLVVMVSSNEKNPSRLSAEKAACVMC